MTLTLLKPPRRAEMLACLAAAFACLALAPSPGEAKTDHPAEGAAAILRPGQTLTRAELTPAERAYYDKHDAKVRQAFLATRSYVRLCQEVVSGELPAIALPDRPESFNALFLLYDEPVVLNRALVKQLTAKDCQGKSPTCVQEHRGFVEMTPAQILTRDQLSPEDRTYYDSLTDPHQADEFIKTRSYVRLCQALNDHKLVAGLLPDEPLGFNLSYLQPGEQDIVNQAIAANLQALAKGGSVNL